MISVVIPLYNADKTIIRALDSIRNQTLPCALFEVWVINDGSTDNSKSLVKSYINKYPELKINLINKENAGVSSARNMGMRLATAEYIALLDADDEWLPQKIEKQCEYLRNEHLDIDLLSSRYNEKPLLFPYATAEKLSKVTFRKMLFRNEVQPSTVIFKKKILQKLIFFDENQHYAEDANYWLRLTEYFSLYILNENLVTAGGGKRTFGVSGLSANLREMARGFQKNLSDMYRAKRISFWELQGYKVFYKMKYYLLIIRSFYYNKMKL